MGFRETQTFSTMRNGNAVLEGLKCGPLDPADANARGQLQTQFTIENRLNILETFIKGVQDIEYGDYLTVDSVDYYVRVANKWDVDGPQRAYTHVLVEDAADADECIHLVYAATTDGYGNADDAYTAGDTLQCVLGSGSMRDLLGASNVPTTSHVARLPIDSTVTDKDRLQVTKRFGRVETNPITYAVVGQPETGRSGLIVQLEKVTE